MINIFRGYDEGEKIAYHVLSESIRRNSSKPVSITPLCLNNIPEFKERNNLINLQILLLVDLWYHI